ncbi:glutamine--tRNA ligase/YqeY domain fusion protein [bacterium]|nr:glutamine--tRNA ligase/YqeY domain fusion protein [bacterium]
MDEKKVKTDFIREIIREDLETGKWKSIHTRFPPEPNGYLHIGHAKSLCINFGLIEEFGGKCNLRFDDTNPVKEDVEYVESIKEDIRWLGFQWNGVELYASDYFEQLFEYAVTLIKEGKAYVCELCTEEIRKYRGTLTEPGKDSPYRNRDVSENLRLFYEMREGKYPDGSKVLRAKIDMSSPNLNMRDPVMYRIIHTSHHRTGDKWCIYPTYDWAHGQSDSIEKITHSICTIEFEDHRPLYNWFIEQLKIHPSRQIEFARLNLTYTVLSKRRLLELVNNKYVEGWDDPRMPTLSGIRRRGYTSTAIKNFCATIGVAKTDSTVDFSLLEYFLREDLNKKADRVMAVLNPVKVVILNYPDDKTEYLEAINNPEDASAGTREIPFSKEIYIEREDFMEDPPKKFYRLSPGREIRLRYAYFIKCVDVIKDSNGNITELHCTYDPLTKGGDSPDGRKVKATLHWVSAKDSIPVTVRLYDRLFVKENPLNFSEGETFFDNINPNSLTTLEDCKIEPSMLNAKQGVPYQFERLGYFCLDRDTKEGQLVFNRTVALKDPWAKIQKLAKKNI